MDVTIVPYCVLNGAMLPPASFIQMLPSICHNEFSGTLICCCRIEATMNYAKSEACRAYEEPFLPRSCLDTVYLRRRQDSSKLHEGVRSSALVRCAWARQDIKNLKYILFLKVSKQGRYQR